ncbi:MAG: hypothetical protein JO368_09495, partial [Acidimicrobiales bacterium]|nr:hypothetical protein [Acidimicrobiales bacterium]
MTLKATVKGSPSAVVATVGSRDFPLSSAQNGWSTVLAVGDPLTPGQNTVTLRATGGGLAAGATARFYVTGSAEDLGLKVTSAPDGDEQGVTIA